MADNASTGPCRSPKATSGNSAFAGAIANTAAKVAARRRSDAPRSSMRVSVVSGATKLTKLI
jgi:hypothetical protein